ncbi:MAG: hypothetical protein LC742_01235, partial [Acidobacteria bacterium]|nr:hypothetical protein [Acidobacteriota bacterium]
MPSVNVCGRPACAAFSTKFLQLFIFTLTLLTLSGTSALAQTTFNVPAGGDLQQALNTAQYGDEIVLEAGASYVGTFTLPNKAGGSPGQFITVRGSAAPAQLPPDGRRITPAHSPLL